MSITRLTDIMYDVVLQLNKESGGGTSMEEETQLVAKEGITYYSIIISIV